jgi:hypothetical protein
MTEEVKGSIANLVPCALKPALLVERGLPEQTVLRKPLGTSTRS